VAEGIRMGNILNKNINSFGCEQPTNDVENINSVCAKLFFEIRENLKRFYEIKASNPEDPRLWEIIEYCNELKGQAARILITE